MRGHFFVLLILASNLSWPSLLHLVKRRSQAKSILGNKYIILFGLANRLMSVLWIYDILFAMYPHTSQMFEHTRVNILGLCEYVQHHACFHCMNTMITGGNKLYMGQLCPGRFL